MACVFPTRTTTPSAWLDAINLAKYKPHLEKAGVTEAAQLPGLTDEQLQAAGVSIIGHRKRILQAAKELEPPAPAAPEDTDVKRKANSTSSIYITSTLTQPDTAEIVFCIAVVIHERILQGEAQTHDVRHRFPFFSEDNNPLYAVPSESEGRGSDSSDCNSDSENKRTRREVPSEDTIFHTIKSVYECAQIPAECLIVALVYMERLVAMTGCPVLVTSWRPILLASLILSQKVWDDRSLRNSDFSIFCPMFTLKEINFLEKKFLELVDYDVTITASLYASYYFQLRTLCQRVEKEFTLKPMDVETAAKLEARGTSQTAKLRKQAPRVNKSANAIHVTPAASSSSFLQKLFN